MFSYSSSSLLILFVNIVIIAMVSGDTEASNIIIIMLVTMATMDAKVTRRKERTPKARMVRVDVLHIVDFTNIFICGAHVDFLPFDYLHCSVQYFIHKVQQ